MKLNWILAVAAMLLGFYAVAETSEEMVKLKIKLPRPRMGSWPKSIKTPNLELPGTKRPVIMVPKDTKLLSAKTRVTSSDDYPVIGELEYVTDGKNDYLDGTFLELGPGTQWVQIDLGAHKPIYAVVVWHYYAYPNAYYDVIIQVADDRKFTKNVRTIFNNDHDNSSGKGTGKDKEYIETHRGRLVDAKGIRARYVRLYSAGNTGSDMNRYTEVKVYGK